MCKKAFRQVALTCHPDRVGNDTAKIERFKQVTEAYRELERLKFPPATPHVESDFTAFWQDLLKRAAAERARETVSVDMNTGEVTRRWTDDPRTRFIWESWMVQQGWKLSRNGNLYQRKDDGWVLTVFPYKNGSWAGLWGWLVTRDTNKTFCPYPEPTQREACEEVLREYRDNYRGAWQWAVT